MFSTKKGIAHQPKSNYVSFSAIEWFRPVVISIVTGRRAMTQLVSFSAASVLSIGIWNNRPSDGAIEAQSSIRRWQGCPSIRWRSGKDWPDRGVATWRRDDRFRMGTFHLSYPPARRKSSMSVRSSDLFRQCARLVLTTSIRASSAG